MTTPKFEKVRVEATAITKRIIDSLEARAKTAPDGDLLQRFYKTGNLMATNPIDHAIYPIAEQVTRLVEIRGEESQRELLLQTLQGIIESALLASCLIQQELLPREAVK